MKPKNVLLLLALLVVPMLAFAQTSTPATPDKEDRPERGMVDFGFRQLWGDVYGRPDLPFTPSLLNSKLNEYRDVRNGPYLRRLRLNIEDVAGTRNYVALQSKSAVYRDQSYLATVGEWGKYKVQLRYDEIPHRYTNTARTLYTQTAPGVFTIAPLVRTTLQTAAATATGCPAGVTPGCNLPSTIQTQVVPGMQFIVPQIDRHNISGTVSYNVTPEWNLFAFYSHENEKGTRPIGQVFNSSPSAALTGGYGVEVPEPISYATDNVRVGTEYGRGDWDALLAYTGSFFHNKIGQFTFDNPFRTSDCVSPNGCTSATQGAAMGRVDEYPDNTAHYLNFAGVVNFGKRTHVMASISPGWLRQNDAFLPYSSNSILLAMAGALPSSSLNGAKQTLAMNYTLVSKPWKNFEIKTAYRQYDYNNNTPSRDFTPIEGDASAPNLANPTENDVRSFFRKNLEVTGNLYFWKKSDFKVGYAGEWFNRTHRDVAHSLENTFLTALDLVPRKDLTLRLGYRHSARNPQSYEDDEAEAISGGITNEQVNHRRFDEAARTRNRADAQLQWDATERLSLSAFGQTIQDDYNKRGDTNSATPLNFLAGTTSPYYLYGVLKEIQYNYGFDADLAVSNAVSLFAEYSHEMYHRRMASRYRAPGSSTIPDGTLVAQNCGGTSAVPCDSANNDWESTSRDLVDIWTIGVDTYLGKRVYFTTYYSLSAGKGNLDSRPLGDPTITSGVNKFVLTGTNAAVNYPETTNRQHEIVAVFKFKLTNNLMPKIEYRYSQWDYRDYQQSAMTPYMGCVSGIPNGPPVTNSVPGCTTPILLTNTVNPAAPGSPFYPNFVVGDPSAARYLFLGADQPSYRAHTLTATIEYHF